MGFTIFESSGTFKPADYGLTVGDMLHLIVVGGGGGGCGTSNLYSAGTAGGASSFGSILTAEGGLSPEGKSAAAPQSGSFKGASGVIGSVGIYYSFTSSSGNTISKVNSSSVFGGGGADGWVPGVCKGRSGLSSTIFAYSQHNASGDVSSILAQDLLGHTAHFAFGEDIILTAISASSQTAGSGGIYSDYSSSVLAISGAGGIGYGAGGGGGCCSYVSNTKAGAGGNSGVIAQKDYLLTSTNPVAVTVGKGGAGGTGYAGGDGTNGCVAIFW